MKNRGSITVEATFVMIITVMLIFGIITFSMKLENKVSATAQKITNEIDEDSLGVKLLRIKRFTEVIKN